jgi:hypothetical protein
MNSPQPLSALQRGAKKLHTPFFCLQEKVAGGMSTYKTEEYFKFLLFISDSYKILNYLSKFKDLSDIS